MTEIFVMKRRAGIEHIIPVWNLGGFIELPVETNIEPELADKLDAILSIENI